MSILVGVVVVGCLIRIAYFQRRVLGSDADERVYETLATAVRLYGFRSLRGLAKTWFKDKKLQTHPPPSRVLYLILGAIATALWKALPSRGLAAMATAFGCATVVFCAYMGFRLGGVTGGIGSAVLVSTCPLLLGIGRRALVDVPSVACQLAVLAVATLGPASWWLVSGQLVVMLLMRESSRTAVPGLLIVVAWLWGSLETALWAGAVGAVGYSLMLWLCIGFWPWEFRTAFGERVLRGQKLPSGHYAIRFCRGGLHRLVVDLMKVSPVVVLAVWALPWSQHIGLLVGAAVVLMAYSLPWLDQQIRSAMAVDVMLRVWVGLVAPWWVVTSIIAVDAYVFWRVWWRARLYDPTSLALGQCLGMGEAGLRVE